MSVSIGDLRPGKNIVHDGQLYVIVNCEHAKLGRGAAFCRTRLKNVHTGQLIECTLRDSDKVEDAFIEKRKLQYLYSQDDILHFMDLETYEDMVIERDRISEIAPWLTDNLELTGLFYENRLINLELPPNLEVEITETEPGFKGDTVKTGTKPAKCLDGVVIQVPLFINPGDKIKIDPRTKNYLGRV